MPRIYAVVTKGEGIRDGSGTYACPVRECWLKHFTGIKKDSPTCPDCGIPLKWRLDLDYFEMDPE